MESFMFESTPGREYAEQAVQEIQEFLNHKAEVHIHVESEVKDKHLYLVTLSVRGRSGPVVVQKSGKNLLPLIKKVKRTALQQLSRMAKKNIHFRRHRALAFEAS